MADMDVEVQEMLHHVLTIGSLTTNMDVLMWEAGRWLKEAGWLTPTEARAIHRHAIAIYDEAEEGYADIESVALNIDAPRKSTDDMDNLVATLDRFNSIERSCESITALTCDALA